MYVACKNKPELREPDKVDDVIDLSGLSEGVTAANAFTGFISPASLVYTDGGAQKFFRQNDTNQAYTAKTVHETYDMEVTTFMRNGVIMLRYANGKGIYLRMSNVTPPGNLVIGMVTSVNEDSPMFRDTANGTLEAMLAGTCDDYGISSTDWNTDTITFGVRGHDIYLKYNGVLLDIPEIRNQAWRLQQKGGALVSYWTSGFRGLTVNYPSGRPANFYSNRAAKIIAMREFGIKSIETTGSIALDSDQLTVADASRFSVGDNIIVETGGETALTSVFGYGDTPRAGRRGTIGVGGSWPSGANLYATEAELLAASPATNGAYGAIDTGKVYVRQTGYWDSYFTTGHYWNAICPHALKAQITAIAGNVLTLSLPAQATTVGAGVYYDNHPLFVPLQTVNLAAVSPADLPSGITMLFDPGVFYTGNLIQATGEFNYWKIKGAGETKTIFKHPKGVRWAFMSLRKGYELTVSDFSLVSNHAEHGYGVYALYDIGIGVGMSINTAGRVERVSFSETPSSAIATSFCTDYFADITINRLVDPDFQYMQWQVEDVDSVGSHIIVNTNSNFLLKSVEGFNASNGTYDIRGRNFMTSMNTATGFHIIARDIVLEKGCRANEGIQDKAIIEIGTNLFNFSGIGSTGGGGRVTVGRIVQEGYLDDENTVMQAINLVGLANVLVEGTYDPTVPDDGNRSGLIQAPPAIASGTTSSHANLGPLINGAALNTTIRGIRLEYVADAPNGTGVAYSEAAHPLNINLYYGSTTTVSGIAALGSSGLGTVTIADPNYWNVDGILRVGTELLQYDSLNFGTGAMNIIARGVEGTTAASHADGSSVTGIDFSVVEDCIADKIQIASTYGTATRNITNAAYAAL